MGGAHHEETEHAADYTNSSLSALFKYVPSRDGNNLQQDGKIPFSPEIPFQINNHTLQNLCIDDCSLRTSRRRPVGRGEADQHLLDDTDTSTNLLHPFGGNSHAAKCFTQKVNFHKMDNEKVIGNIRVLKLDHISSVSKEEVVDSPAFLLKGFNNLKRNSLTSSLLSAHDERRVSFRYSYIGKKFSQLKAKCQEDFDNEPQLSLESKPNFVEQKAVSSCCCKSSRCLKLYCDCFKSNGFCGESCCCVNCLNQKNTPEAREAAISKYVQKRVKSSPSEIPPTLLEKGVEEVFLATNKTRENQASCRCKVSSCAHAKSKSSKHCLDQSHETNQNSEQTV